MTDEPIGFAEVPPKKRKSRKARKERQATTRKGRTMIYRLSPESRAAIERAAEYVGRPRRWMLEVVKEKLALAELAACTGLVQRAIERISREAEEKETLYLEELENSPMFVGPHQPKENA